MELNNLLRIAGNLQRHLHAVNTMNVAVSITMKENFSYDDLARSLISTPDSELYDLILHMRCCIACTTSPIDSQLYT